MFDHPTALPRDEQPHATVRVYGGSLTPAIQAAADALVARSLEADAIAAGSTREGLAWALDPEA